MLLIDSSSLKMNPRILGFLLNLILILIMKKESLKSEKITSTPPIHPCIQWWRLRPCAQTVVALTRATMVLIQMMGAYFCMLVFVPGVFVFKFRWMRLPPL